MKPDEVFLLELLYDCMIDEEDTWYVYDTGSATPINDVSLMDN